MATYSRELLEPLVAALERSQARVSELERENGRISTELAASEGRYATLTAPGATATPAPPTEPSPDPLPTSSLPLPPNVMRGWRVWAAWLVGVLVAAVALLAWPW